MLYSIYMSATHPTASTITDYSVCFTVLDRNNEVHTRFAVVTIVEGFTTQADIPRILAERYARARLVKNVSVISALELDEDEL